MDDRDRRQIAWGRIAILIVVLLVIAGTSYWLITSSKSKPKTVASTTCSAQSTSKKCPKKSAASSTPATSSTRPAASTPSTSTPTSTATAYNAASSQLTNTGPGNVIALFIGVAVISGLSHHIYSKKHIKHSSNSSL